MTEYYDYALTLSEGQKNKLRHAHQTGRGTSITLSYSSLSGSDKVKLSKTQIDRIKKAIKNRKGTTLTFSAAQLKKTGGFLPLLAAGLGGLLLPKLFGGGRGRGAYLPGTTGKGVYLPGGGKMVPFLGRGYYLPGTRVK